MKELNISTFIQIMQVGSKEHDGQFATRQFQSEDGRFEPCYEDLSDMKISLLVSRQRSVPNGIKQVAFLSELVAVAMDYI